jgi:hypothetical protein
MNTASRMESTGIPGRIQISQETAHLLLAAGKEDWYSARESKVEAKGKGALQTYFLNVPSSSQPDSDGGSVHSAASDQRDGNYVDPAISAEKRNRVAEWTIEVLSKLLKEIVASRKSSGIDAEPRSYIEEVEVSLSADKGEKRVIDEVAEVIHLANYTQFKKQKQTAANIDLDKKVLSELRNYVQTIATLYNDNAFHNFDHANHVVMSVNKLLSRIVSPDIDDFSEQNLHDCTYGITSDPLVQFACVFSALIHDVDHSGAPNSQLIKEGAPIAILYKGASVAEQNSFDLAWDLLLEPAYKNFRETIYVTVGELKRFRQLVVNSVMATDIVDKHLKKVRNDRWESAFSTQNEVIGPSCRSTTMKATIVIEHLIQASDVAHTMQHWHVYRRWNEKFFNECYQAYLDGRAESDPSVTWYEGEIGFFDYYIIPLAKKLKECGVFGVSSDEYWSYATQNRKEWAERGEDLVKDMVKRQVENKKDIRV